MLKNTAKIIYCKPYYYVERLAECHADFLMKPVDESSNVH